MRGRNKLLSEPAPDRAWLDAIETEMAALAVAIAAARREWAGLAAAMIAAGGDGPFPAAELALEGTLEAAVATAGARAAEGGYRAPLRDQRGRDAAAGRTPAGPHLPDLSVPHP